MLSPQRVVEAFAYISESVCVRLYWLVLGALVLCRVVLGLQSILGFAYGENDGFGQTLVHLWPSQCIVCGMLVQ